jgi:short-subunit dehydrogenase
MSQKTFRTALITGASAGLGAEYARQLAAAGADLVLVARRLDRLDDLARELREKHAVTVETLQADLATSDGIDRVERRLAGDETLDLLVNDAGFSGGKSFVERAAADHMDMVQVHVAASVRLSRAALPGMISRGRGAIINVASIAAWSAFSGPMYSGTKAFLVMFSENLQSELRGTGVNIQALCPGLTHTEFHAAAAMDTSGMPGILWMTAERVVRISLRRLGRGAICIPGIRNKSFAFLMRCPVTAAGVRVFSRLPAVRKRADR